MLKSSLIVLALAALASQARAASCNLISGYFKTTTSQCRYSRDGVKFFDEGSKDIKITYSENLNVLTVLMNVSSGPYTLSYVADGKEQIGRPMFEGEKYVAQCENNHLHVRAEMSALKNPFIHDYNLTVDGKMVYQESFEGDSFIRVCEMERGQ